MPWLDLGAEDYGEVVGVGGFDVWLDGCVDCFEHFLGDYGWVSWWCAGWIGLVIYMGRHNPGLVTG